jgi:glycosyltransferase 2 family protein
LSPISKRTGSLLRWLPGLLISLMAIILLVYLTNWSDVWQAVLAIPLPVLLVAILAYFCGLLLRAQTWKILLQNKASYSRVFLTLNEGYLLNNLLPFRLGELGMILLLSQGAQLSAFFVLSTIIVQRAYDMAIAASLLLASLPLALQMQSAGTVAIIVLAGVVLGFLVLFLAATYRGWIKQKLESKFSSSQRFQTMILPRLDALLQGLEVLTRPSQFLLSIAFMFASWFFGMLEIHLLIRGVGAMPVYWWTAFILGIVSLGIAVPSAPAGLGVYEGAMLLALSALGVPPALGLAVAIVAHVIHITITGVIGSIALIRDGQSLVGLYQRLRHSEISQAS